MREFWNNISYGRMSVRNRFVLVITLVLAIFLTVGPLAQTSFAEDVVRTGDTATFEGRGYTRLTTIPDNLKSLANTANIKDPQALVSQDPAAGKAYMLVTDGDITKAASARQITFDFSPPDVYTNPNVSGIRDVTFAAAPTTQSGTPPQAPAQQPAANTANNAPKSSCSNASLGAIGWIICPVTKFLAEATDFIYTKVILGSFEVKSISNDTNTSIYRPWVIVRDVANICFVIAFLIIVYSQLTSIGISNYGLKKMIPRLIIAAIVVNISYWICAACVDASNILGNSIHTLFKNLATSINNGNMYNIPDWTAVTTTILGGGTLLGLGIYVAAVPEALFALVPLVIGAVIALMVTYLILAARQALIVCFVIISPLAFVAYLLPNTEKYFDKWKDAFLTLIMLFPIFSVVFSGAQLAGIAIVQSAGSNILTILLGMAVQVMPLAITPLLMKLSGGLLNRFAGIVNNPSKGIMDRTRNWAKQAHETGRNSRIHNTRKYRGPVVSTLRKGQSIKRRFDNNSKYHQAMADNYYNSTEAGKKWTEKMMDADSNKQEVAADFARSAYGERAYRRKGMADADHTRAMNSFESSQSGRAVDMAKRAAEREKKTIENEHQTHWDNASRTDASLLNSHLTLKRSEADSALAKATLEQMDQEILAKGDATEHIMNIRGATGAQISGMLDVAQKIKNANIKSDMSEFAQSNAKQQYVDAVNDLILSDASVDGARLQQLAAGIGTTSSVLAHFVAKSRKQFGERVAEKRELAEHFKLQAADIAKLALAETSITKTDDKGNTYTFEIDDDYTRDMAVDDVFVVGSHDDKMKVVKQTGKYRDADGNEHKGANYEHRFTIQRAMIKSGFAKSAPSLGDKTNDVVIAGEFYGDESEQYHALREILEKRINSSTLSTTHANSMKRLFADVNTDDFARTQFNKLIDSSVPKKLATMREKDPTATEADAREALIQEFHKNRRNLQQMATDVLRAPATSQNVNQEAIEELQAFAAGSRPSGGAEPEEEL